MSVDEKSQLKKNQVALHETIKLNSYDLFSFTLNTISHSAQGGWVQTD
jgi:hypothetical protein